MNKVFLTGRLKIGPEVTYTPKGERILTFPLWVDDDAFSVDVIYLDRQGIKDFAGLMGGAVTVSGKLTRSADRHGALKVRANKILWMEE